MKAFRLFDVSLSRNSLGLKGCILVAKDGEAWEIGSNDLNCPQAGKDYNVSQPSPAYWAHPKEVRYYEDQDDLTASTWSSRGWEIPRRLAQAPQEAVDRAFRPVVPAQEERLKDC